MYYFIVNPLAGGGNGLRAWQKVEKALLKRGIKYESCMTGAAGHGRDYAAAITKAPDSGKTDAGGAAAAEKIITVIGGDGTFSEVLDGLRIDSGLTIAHIPVGVGNDMARSLHLPDSVARRIRKILRPTNFRYLDYGVVTYNTDDVHHHRFIVSAGIGLDAAICYNEDHLPLKMLFGRMNIRRLPGFLSRLRAYLLAQPTSGYIILDGVQRIEFSHIYFMSAQLMPYECGGLRIAPKADASDGRMEVCVLSHRSKRDISSVLFNIKARVARIPGMRVFECREVQIHVDDPRIFHVDGESTGEPVRDLEAYCVERRIRMII